jgi:hypothetical protein
MLNNFSNGLIKTTCLWSYVALNSRELYSMSLKQKQNIFGAMLSTILVNYYTLSFLIKQVTFGARLPTILENHTL